MSNSQGEASDSNGSTGEPTAGSDSMSDSLSTGAGSMSDSLSGTTGDEGGMSESLSGTLGTGVESESNSGGTTEGSTGMISGSGSTTDFETTENPVDCQKIDNEADCIAADCMPIHGRLIVGNDAMKCQNPPSFLACDDPQICAEVIITACKGDNQYKLPNSCVPEFAGYAQCDDPPNEPPGGFKDCQ